MVLEFLLHPVVFNALIIIASLFILLKAADLLVEGISRYAEKLGLSDALIGLVVVAMAASSPEIISALMGFLSGEESIGFGAVLGNNMVHAALGIGIVAVLGKNIKIEPNIFTKHRLIMWAAVLLPFILAGFDGELSRGDGVILIAAFCFYFFYLWKIEGKFGKLKRRVKLTNIWRDAFIFLGCLAALLLAGRWLVHSSIILADAVGIPAYFIGLTVIGIGTTLPDLAVELKSVFKKHPSIGIGDLLGSFTIELLLFLGILSLIKPLTINPALVWNAALFLVLSISFVMFILKGKSITWKHGLVLLGLFAVFLAIEIIKMV